MDAKKVGRFIAENRKKQNMTQVQLAEKIHVRAKTISRWENGNYMPDISLLIPLSEKIGVNVQELLLGEYIEDSNLVIKTNESIKTVMDLSKQKVKKSLLQIIILGMIASVLLLIIGVLPILKEANTRDVNYYIKLSDSSNQDEIKFAMDLACDYFESTYYNCDLMVLSYNEQDSLDELNYWIPNSTMSPGDKLIILKSIFKVGKLGGPSYLEKGHVYLDYYYVVKIFADGRGYVTYYGNLNTEELNT